METHAKDYKCFIDGCDKQAVVFVGLNDPDGEMFPECREHADSYKLRILLHKFDHLSDKQIDLIAKNHFGKKKE